MSRSWTLSTLSTLLAVASCGDEGAAPPDAAAHPPDAAAPAVDASPPDAEAPDASPFTITQDKIGRPVWTIGGWQLYSARVGTPADGFSEYLQLIEDVWPKHSYDAQYDFMAPDVVHAPPYDDELSTGLAALGIEGASQWPRAAWTSPQGLVLSAVLLPGLEAPLGPSTDFDDGPVIPNAVFPLHIDGSLYQGDSVIDSELDGTLVAITVAMPGSQAAGYSHLPFDLTESTGPITGEAGDYAFSVQVTDPGGNGWRVRIPFEIH